MKDIAIYRLKRVELALERLDKAVARLNSAVSRAKTPLMDTEKSENGDFNDKNVVKKYIKLKKVSSMALQRIEMIIKHLEISKDNINKP